MKKKIIIILLISILFFQCRTISFNKDIKRNKKETIPLVIIPGFGNYKTLLIQLQIMSKRLYEQNRYGKVYIFDYRFPSNDKKYLLSPINARINILQSRFYSFLEKKDLLNKKINIVGYSSGAVIGLSSAAKYYNHENPIILNKYISIAGPFDGIFFDQQYRIPENFLLIHDLYQYSNFMQDEFDVLKNPSLKSILTEKEKSDFLNITHKEDVVSQSWSTGKFDEYMTNYIFYDPPGKIKIFDTKKILSEFLEDLKSNKNKIQLNNNTNLKKIFNDIILFNNEPLLNRNKMIDMSQSDIYKYLFTQEHLSLPTNPDVIKLIIEFLTKN